MTLVYIADIGSFKHPLNYLYFQDKLHPSSNKCHCGRLLHIAGNTSDISVPIRYYYHDVCVYHYPFSFINFIKSEKRYDYDRANNKFALSL